MLIQGKLLSCGDDLTEVFNIRRKVFVEEQSIPEEIEFDGLDSNAMHVLVYEATGKDNDAINNYEKLKTVATGRIMYDGTRCQMGHVAVLPEYRGKKYGDFTVRMLLNKAFNAGIMEVELNALLSSVEFYKKIGFQEISNNTVEANSNYCKMVISADKVITLCNKIANNG